MHNIIYTPQAQSDLEGIRDFVARDNEDMAIKVVETIFFYINNLSLFPLIGKESISQLGFREIVEPTFRYRIVYHFDGKDIWILMIGKYKNM